MPALEPAHIGASNLGQVSAEILLHLRQRQVELSWPSPSAHQRGHVAQAGAGASRGARRAGEEPCQRDFSRGVPRLEQRHRTHPDPAQPARTGVAGHVVGGLRRSSQDEQPAVAAGVAGMANVVPNCGQRLPLVEQPRRRALQQGGRLHCAYRAGVDVGVKADRAARKAQPRPRLAAGSRPLQHQPSGRAETSAHLGVHDSGPVASGSQGRGVVLYRLGHVLPPSSTIPHTRAIRYRADNLYTLYEEWHTRWRYPPEQVSG